VFDGLLYINIPRLSHNGMENPRTTITPWSRVLPENLTYPQLVKKLPAFLPHSQALATCPYPEPFKSSPCCPILLLTDPFLYFFSHLRVVLPSSLFPSILHKNPVALYSLLFMNYPCNSNSNHGVHYKQLQRVTG